MSRTVNIDEMADAINEGLKEYATLASTEVKKAVRKSAKTVKEQIQSGAPSRTGRYKESWVATKQSESSQSLQMVVHVVNNNSGYEGDLEIALIPESFLTDIMHEELDGNGVLAENANVELEHFAFLFEFDGDQRHIRHVLYNCVASRPSIEGETNEDSKEVKTDTLNLQATPLANGYVKAKTGTNTTDDVYNKWYDAVYEPQAEAVDTEDTSHTEEPQG